MAAAVTAGVWRPAAGQETFGLASVTFQPARPLQGSLFTVRVVVDTLALPGPEPLDVRGVLAGERLHFEPVGGGAFVAVGAVPVDASDSASGRLVLRRGGHGRAWLEMTVPVSAAQFGVDQLRVDTRFATPLDSALSERVADEGRRARAVSARAHETPRLWDGPFERPRPSRVTSGFGRRREFNGTLRSRHWGVDLAGNEGDPVRATNRGVVALVDQFYYGGGVIYLDHGAGLVTAYLHLSRHDVSVGDTVVAGQIIGRVGATGRVTGPHLHWIVRYGRISVDALSLDALGLQTAECRMQNAEC